MKAGVIREIKRARSICLAVLAGLAVPFLIWAAVVFGARQLYREWRSIRAGLIAGNLVCRLNADCPPGYVCAQGRCMPVSAK